jgi:hypothetical protein
MEDQLAFGPPAGDDRAGVRIIRRVGRSADASTDKEVQSGYGRDGNRIYGSRGSATETR